MVNYDVEGFCEKNKDVLFVDLIEMMKGSQGSLIQTIFAGDKVCQGGVRQSHILPLYLFRLTEGGRNDRPQRVQRSRARLMSW